MKLFKSLLVAPATLGLLAPMSATANEITINDFNPAEEIAITNSRVDGLEARFDNLQAGAFSETTSASFSADFAIGSVDGKGITSALTDGDEDLQATYGFQIDLNTSFTGEDSLDISLDAGGSTATSLGEFDLNGTSDAVNVDGVSYTFPLGDSITAYVGDNTDGSNLFTTACAYGGPSNTLDDCGNVNAAFATGGVSTGASYDFGNGLTLAVGYEGGEDGATSPSATGLGTKESMDGLGANLAYIADNYGVSLTYASIETGTLGVDTDTYTALNAYYSFDNGVSISAGYEVGALGGEVAAQDETLAYFLGVSGAVGAGELGAAMGTTGSMTEANSTITEELMYEAYYSYPLNDGMTITPLVYVQEKATAGTPDSTGVMVKTSFSF